MWTATVKILGCEGATALFYINEENAVTAANILMRECMESPHEVMRLQDDVGHSIYVRPRDIVFVTTASLERDLKHQGDLALMQHKAQHDLQQRANRIVTPNGLVGNFVPGDPRVRN